MAVQSKKELQSIEDLAEKLMVGKAILAGVKASRKWGVGKQVSESEFKKALSAFLDSPADGRKSPGKK